MLLNTTSSTTQNPASAPQIPAFISSIVTATLSLSPQLTHSFVGEPKAGFHPKKYEQPAHCRRRLSGRRDGSSAGAGGAGARRLLLRRARVAFRFFLLMILLILFNNFSPFGAYYFLNDGLQIFGAGFVFVLIFTYGYLWGVMNMEEVVDSPIN